MVRLRRDEAAARHRIEEERQIDERQARQADCRSNLRQFGIALASGGMRACLGALWLTICALLLTDYVRRFRAFSAGRHQRSSA